MPQNNDQQHDSVIRVRGLRTRFGTHIVHDHLDLDVRKGEILGVVGGSGSGKSVLMKAIIGLIKRDRGEIRIFGRTADSITSAEQHKQRRRLGVLFQDGALFSALTVGQNVQAPIREYFDVSQELLDEIAAVKISLAGLPASAGPKYPSDLSGGMRKRASLARALAMDPEILFLDEPTSGLDPVTAARFDELILELRDALGLTVFLVTHDLDTLARVCDRIAVLAEKKVVVVDTMENLVDYDHPWVQEYFCGPRGRAAQAGSK